MFTVTHIARRIRRAAVSAAAIAVCVCAVWSSAQRPNGPARGFAPQSHPFRNQQGRFQPRRGQFAALRNQQRNQMRMQNRTAMNNQFRMQNNAQRRYADGGYPGSNPQPDFAHPGQSRPVYPARPDYQGYAQPAPAPPLMQGPPGHLGDWLNQHRNLPVEDQERMLRRDPSFRQLAPSDQQRVIGQLHQVDQLPEDQRQRRLARAELIEHLSPQDRMRINLSARRWATLPPDRQAMMKNAFRDLRSVPPDQRPMVLNSSRYQGVFSPDERGILSDMLRVEPYEPAPPVKLDQ